MALQHESSIGKKVARILIVDDHPAVCEGLAFRISAQPDMTVCGQAADVGEALEKIRELSPHLVIVDLALKKSDGLDLVKRLKATHRHTLMLVHSMYDEKVYADRCLKAGAQGYLNKEANPEEVIKAIREIIAGNIYLSPQMTRQILGRVGSSTSATDPIETLTNRQLEVFRLIGEGLSAREISDQLGISVHTVETHRENIKQKLQVSTLSELNRRAVLWVSQDG